MRKERKESMRFLDDEWYEIHLKKIGETFTVPGKLNTSLVEVYRNVWGGAGQCQMDQI